MQQNLIKCERINQLYGNDSARKCAKIAKRAKVKAFESNLIIAARETNTVTIMGSFISFYARRSITCYDRNINCFFLFYRHRICRFDSKWKNQH